jgi:hypothetical protein
MTLSHPAAVLERLEAIDRDLANRLPELEAAALAWFRAKRDREKARAEVFLTTQGTVAERSAHADRATVTIGVDDEARYEALKAVVRVLEARSMIGLGLLKAQGRGA